MKNAIDALRGPLGALHRAWGAPVIYTLHSGETATLYDYSRGMRAQDVFAAAMQQDQLCVIQAGAFAVAFAPRATPARLDRLKIEGRNWTVEEWRSSPMIGPVFFKLLVRGGSQ